MNEIAGIMWALWVLAACAVYTTLRTAGVWRWLAGQWAAFKVRVALWQMPKVSPEPVREPIDWSQYFVTSNQNAYGWTTVTITPKQKSEQGGAHFTVDEPYTLTPEPPTPRRPRPKRRPKP